MLEWRKIVLKWFESKYWNIILLRRIDRLKKKKNLKEICEECYEKHLPNTVKPNFITCEILDFFPNLSFCDYCGEMHFTIYVFPTEEELLPMKKFCDDCQEETDHLLIYDESVYWNECQKCNGKNEYKESEN